MTDSSVPPNSASRKHPTANLARGIEDLDGVGSLAIAKRSSPAPRPENVGRAEESSGAAHVERSENLERKTSPSTATLAAASKHGESSSKSASKSGGLEVNDAPGQSSLASRPSRSTSRPRSSVRPPAVPSIWPQWLFATAVLGAALWYLFSVEPPHNAGRAVQVEPRALTPKK